MSTCPVSVITTADYILLAIVVFSTFLGFIRGFVREMLGLISWVGAFWLAIARGHWLDNFFAQWIDNKVIGHLSSMGLVFVGALIVFLTLSQLLSYRIQNSLMQSVNRSLGIVFGFLRSFVVIFALYFSSLLFIPIAEQPEIMRCSKSAVWLNHGSLLFWRQYMVGFLASHEGKDTIAGVKLGALRENIKLLETEGGGLNSVMDVSAVMHADTVQDEVLPSQLALQNTMAQSTKETERKEELQEKVPLAAHPRVDSTVDPTDSAVATLPQDPPIVTDTAVVDTRIEPEIALPVVPSGSNNSAP